MTIREAHRDSGCPHERLATSVLPPCRPRKFGQLPRRAPQSFQGRRDTTTALQVSRGENFLAEQVMSTVLEQPLIFQIETFAI